MGTAYDRYWPEAGVADPRLGTSAVEVTPDAAMAEYFHADVGGF